jgi:hypothetical protein
MEEIMEPALVPALRNFAHFREVNELGCPTRKYRLGASSSSRARLIRRAHYPSSTLIGSPIGQTSMTHFWFLRGILQSQIR